MPLHIPCNTCSRAGGLHAARPIPTRRRDRLEALLNYAARHPFNPRRIDYNPQTGQVIYRANRTHGTRHTNTVEAHAVDFIPGTACTQKCQPEPRVTFDAGVDRAAMREALTALPSVIGVPLASTSSHR